jgi:hypothetical protein
LSFHPIITTGMARTYAKRLPRRVAARIFGLAASALILAGCSAYHSVMSEFSSSSSSESGAAPGGGGGGGGGACPAPTILHPLANTAIFRAAAANQRPNDVAFYGLLSDATATCDTSGNALVVKLNVVVVGQRGPAAGSAQGVDLDYFVAATGPDQRIISKNPFRVHVPFESGRVRAGVTDHIEEAIPLAGQSPANINLLLGFQLSPAAVDFYKRFRGR